MKAVSAVSYMLNCAVVYRDVSYFNSCLKNLVCFDCRLERLEERNGNP